MLGTRVRQNKIKQQVSVEEKDDKKSEDTETDTDRVQVEIVDQTPKDVSEKKEEEVKDSWDAESSGDEQEEEGNNLFIFSRICRSYCPLSLQKKMLIQHR